MQLIIVEQFKEIRDIEMSYEELNRPQGWLEMFGLSFEEQHDSKKHHKFEE